MDIPEVPDLSEKIYSKKVRDWHYCQLLKEKWRCIRERKLWETEITYQILKKGLHSHREVGRKTGVFMPGHRTRNVIPILRLKLSQKEGFVLCTYVFGETFRPSF